MEKLSINKLTNIPVYDLGDIILRPIREDDYHDMFLYGSDPEVTKTLFWDTYKEETDALESIKNVFLTRPAKGVPLAHGIVHKNENKMIGTCDIFFIDYERGLGEIGYCLNRKYWNKGYTTKACKKVIEFGFDYLGLDKIIIRHHKGNIGSRRVIEKSGFKYLKDVYLESKDEYFPTYSLTKEDFFIR
ncbi:GNAT family N-acetyltransferase [Candidatus Izemoplasma sp. B36]|uniref:GNAT family N-acetyltransferase n=1 Tax=Candidatus Izemoplasma sp. B36 TaxID=3242468 RepID=UPI00355784D0